MRKLSSLLAVFSLLFRAQKAAFVPETKSETTGGTIADEVTAAGSSIQAAAPALAPKIQKVEKIVDTAQVFRDAVKNLGK